MTLHSVLIQKLLSTNAHLGRRAATHHFKIYTHGVRNGQTIIDSDKTLICLRNAANFIAHLVREKNARFLFVNTNPLFDEIVEQMTKKIGLYSPKDAILWKMGGFLTNSFSPKKFRSRNKKVCFGPIQPPDCVVVLDTERKSSVILEADRLQVPIVALVDSNMPWEYYKRIAYPIPANDSVEFVYLFCNMITKTFLHEQKKLRALKGEIVDEEPQAIPKKESKEMQQIEKSKSERNIGSPAEDVLVVPYQILSSISNDTEETKKLLDKLLVVKFNDTLGTSVGFDGPKSAIEVNNGLTSLDLIVKQIESLNSMYGCQIPLVLMSTSKTHDNTLKVLGKYSTSNINILPLSQDSMEGQSSNDELYPSGDAVVFLSLMKSGILDVLLSRGKEYVHVVSSDNMAAVVDPKILNHLIQNRIDYCMEMIPTATNSSSMINQQPENITFSEIMQNPSKHSTESFKFIDTKGLWMNLKAIKRLVDTDELKIENLLKSKEVDGDQVFLQETAAGAAIRLFDQAIGISVPQSRFALLNATADLLLLQSDLYSSAGGVLVQNTARVNPVNPSIHLGPEFDKVGDFLARFKSVPSIVELESLKVTGDVWFGAGVTLKGRVTIDAKPGSRLEIPDGAVLENKEINVSADI